MASSTSLRRTNSNRTNNMAVAGVTTATTASSKTLISISDNNKKPTGTGKENPRSISRTRNSVIPQKPRQRPIPAIEKPTKEFNDSKVRRSTSSVPRGRSSSPNDFTRILSDFRNNKDNRDRMPRVSVSDNLRSTNKTLENVGRNDIVGYGKGKDFSSSSRVLDKSQPKKANFCSNLKDNEKSMRPKDGVTESLSSNVKPVERSFDVFKRLSGSKGGEVNLSSGLIKIGGKVENSSATEGCKEKGNIVVNAEGKLEASRIGISRVFVSSGSTGSVGVNLKPQGSKGWNSSKFVDSVKEKGNAEEEKGVKLSGKYQSKLHEKLAFLEGKVKRIASDIKRTKDMLDMNNPDGSKVIISDIQDKISGIEKAMVHVITDDSSSLIASKAVESDGLNSKSLEHNEIVQVGQLKNSVKRLNHEDIEARLFPHHKLLEGQTSWSTSSASGQSDRPHLPEVTGDSKLENVPLSPIDDNPIALEFLASLHKGKPKEITQNDYIVEYYEVHEMDGAETSASQDKSKAVGSRNRDGDATLIADEVIEDIENQENKSTMALVEEIEDMRVDQLHEIGRKASTGGWFVSEGESVLLAHEDGSCSFYDITNSEEKAEYNPPAGLSPNLWGDCWLIRAAGADGCSGRYVVAASSGNALESGFCSWDFYTRDVRAFHLEDATVKSSRTVLGPLPSIGLYRRSASSTIMVPENRQWWYRPCGPLLVSTASGQKAVKVYDIRDGDEVMKWELQKPVAVMDYSSPLQWRDRGKVVLAEAESVSLWDVNSLTPQALLSVSSNGRQISALHVHNTDAELGGGVRRRVSSVEGNDGVFCTQESICVLDFRLPSGVGLKVSKHGLNVQSISSRGDSIFLGCTDGQLSTVSGKAHSRIQQYSLRKGTILSTYALPESNSHFHYTAISQVWGNTNVVMGVCGLGLFVFDTLQQEEGESSSLAVDYMKTQQTRDVIGPNDLYSPSFDYSSSRVLVISRDRPAFWRYLL
ncbi:hypothetical protein C5167_042782 [Papaver somniferum]|uniref:At4g14310 8-bladed propeller domain-containing protein n=1 Tax=Papaver somniferum TaxID=3469 RepID=A0A4Y7L4U4_PAPSO|nr:KIN14B-interacting protein At4g14310-like [Papaver somniferum]RZC80206.1 hypothetical protein C5167_042782 [Papaver somniferum]